MSKYAVGFEGDDATGYSAYVLDLPGVIATGKTLDKTRERMRSAIDFHLRGLRADGGPIPQPACVVEMIEAATARRHLHVSANFSKRKREIGVV